MKSSAERLDLMHQKAQTMRRKRDRMSFALSGTLCTVLLLSLFAVILRYQELSPNVPEKLYTGSSLMSDGAGGYILVALIAFMLGVVITVILKKQQKKRKRHIEEHES